MQRLREAPSKMDLFLVSRTLNVSSHCVFILRIKFLSDFLQNISVEKLLCGYLRWRLWPEHGGVEAATRSTGRGAGCVYFLQDVEHLRNPIRANASVSLWWENEGIAKGDMQSTNAIIQGQWPGRNGWQGDVRENELQITQLKKEVLKEYFQIVKYTQHTAWWE
jgi:hypothetical protein